MSSLAWVSQIVAETKKAELKREKTKWLENLRFLKSFAINYLVYLNMTKQTLQMAQRRKWLLWVIVWKDSVHERLVPYTLAEHHDSRTVQRTLPCVKQEAGTRRKQSSICPSKTNLLWPTSSMYALLFKVSTSFQMNRTTSEHQVFNIWAWKEYIMFRQWHILLCHSWQKTNGSEKYLM